MSSLLSLGLVSVTSGLVLCGVVAAIGVVLFSRVDPARVQVGAIQRPTLADARGVTA